MCSLSTAREDFWVFVVVLDLITVSVDTVRFGL